MNIGLERKGGFECGTAGAKLVLLKRRKADVRVETVSLEDIPIEIRSRGKSVSPMEISRKLIIQHNLSKYKVTFTSGQVAESCFVLLPRMDKADLAGARFLQARKLLAWEEEEPTVAYVDSDFPNHRVGSVVALSSWTGAKAWCRLIEGSGGAVENITVPACAFEALAKHQGWHEKHSIILVADLGAASSCFYVLDPRGIRFIRKIPYGGDAITKALTTEMSAEGGAIRLSEVEAEHLKTTGSLPPRQKMEGVPPVITALGPADAGQKRGSPEGVGPARLAQHVETMARPVIERMVSEVQRSMQFFKENAGQEVQAIYLTGGASCLETLRARLPSSVRVPVNAIDPFQGMRFAREELETRANAHKARLAVAVGLALADQPCLSLLPARIQGAKRAARFAPIAVVCLLALGFIPLLVSGAIQSARARKVGMEVKRRGDEMNALGRERGELERIQSEVQKAKERGDDLATVMTRNPLWAGVLNSLAEAVPPHAVLTHLATDFSKSKGGSLTVQGRVLASASGFDNAVAALLSALNASPFFSQVRVTAGEAAKTEDGLGRFEIKCELVY